MPYQFKCPNGHLLEALETQAGDQCNCPHCGVLMVIPPAPAPPPGAAAGAHDVVPGVTQPPPGTTGVPAIETEPEPEDLLHIPCPNGHVLDTPRDMIGQVVMCPHCETEFRLRESDSEEYQRRKQMQQERRERRVGNLWLNWSIVIAVIVVIGIVTLIFISSASN